MNCTAAYMYLRKVTYATLTVRELVVQWSPLELRIDFGPYNH